MFAIVKIAGRQYRVSPDQLVKVDLLETEPGGQVAVNEVLLVSDGGKVEIGNPEAPFTVHLEVVRHDRKPKVYHVRFMRRGGVRRRRGHRQPITIVKVKSIQRRA
ncbi:MAG: 50S ribosomal protein L21 [Calditrichota bacterium]